MLFNDSKGDYVQFALRADEIGFARHIISVEINEDQLNENRQSSFILTLL